MSNPKQRDEITPEIRLKHPPTGKRLPSDFKILERYPLEAPFSYAVIAEPPNSISKLYCVDEENELVIPRTKVDAKTSYRRVNSAMSVSASASPFTIDGSQTSTSTNAIATLFGIARRQKSTSAFISIEMNSRKLGGPSPS